MNSIYFLLNFFIGACLASHANVIYERWDTRNFIFSRSYCDNCKSTLSLLDEIPLFSYLLLKGKCKYCQKNIPRELFFFELVGGFAFCTINFSDKSQIITSIFIFLFF
ncbi:prepilin peptidase [Lactobacillus acidophilus]|uniref:prepilin peptidase n=1 Tax=Lactobacillus acidophilus TaxID=1579 RepID=UPI001E3C77A0|nr:prepilin peptidase [Lactobacillus acidophilus]